MRLILQAVRPRAKSMGEYPTLVRMTEWVEARLQLLEGELTAQGISTALLERKLFPEVDDLAVPEPEEDSD